jgi:hypothetical protein
MRHDSGKSGIAGKVRESKMYYYYSRTRKYAGVMIMRLACRKGLEIIGSVLVSIEVEGGSGSV